MRLDSMTGKSDEEIRRLAEELHKKEKQKKELERELEKLRKNDPETPVKEASNLFLFGAGIWILGYIVGSGVLAGIIPARYGYSVSGLGVLIAGLGALSYVFAFIKRHIKLSNTDITSTLSSIHSRLWGGGIILLVLGIFSSAIVSVGFSSIPFSYSIPLLGLSLVILLIGAILMLVSKIKLFQD